MKRLAAYYLILLYALSIAKPFTVWFADVMAHAYIGHQHMMVVHGGGGKDHVHFQMNKAAKDDAPEQKTSNPKNENEVTVASFIESISRIDLILAKKPFSRKAVHLPGIFLSVQLPPPWAFGA